MNELTSAFPRALRAQVAELARGFPVLTITGPQHSGKSTLCRIAFPEKPYANLESPDIRREAIEDPRGFLARYPEGAVLVEVKSGQTVRPEWGRALQRAARYFDHVQGRAVRLMVVYAGDRAVTLDGVGFVPWNAVGRVFAEGAA